MSKLLFWIVVILAALIVARLAARNAARRRMPPDTTTRHPAGDGSQTLVRCAHCGIQLPTSEAVRRKGYNYCGLPHSLKGPSR